MRALFLCLSLIAAPAMAADGSDCSPVAKMKQEHKDFTWNSVTSARQEGFLAGTFAMNPETHPGLPVGDKAFVVTKQGSDGALIIWTDATETLSCDAMPIPKELLDLLNKVQAGGGDDL